ncbi:MAG: hypothetical protein J3Q66DRAFT_405509 [Benniella sp.]|nr:MAG: hypothetical protein J3Q66DRAFT_405509 [Benniella sp.]
MSKGTGYVYNVKSSSWTVFQNVNFTSIHQSAAVTDPETGFIYLPSGGENFAGREVMLSVDLKTGKVNTTDLYRDTKVSIHPASISAPVIWSELLRGFLILMEIDRPFVFTPSKATNSTNGWSTFVIGECPNIYAHVHCGAPAYGGSKMIFIATGQYFMEGTFLYILDVAERTWKEGPRPPTYLVSNSCAVTGDQFISWGGFLADDIATNATLVYNLKTETWTSEYIAPSPIQSTSDSTSREKGLVNIILVITGALLTVILTAISVYIGLTKRLKDTHSSGSGSSGVSSNSHTRRNWFTTRLLGGLHQGSYGAQPLSGDPHAVVTDPPSRNVQEGAVEVQFPIQYPHTTIEQDSSANHNSKAEWESIQYLSVLAQEIRPAPDFLKCSAFAEGQGLYLLGGQNEENFMLDLSVSWKTSDPVFKKIEGGPRVSGRACAMTNNGEDLFVMSKGTGYVHNVKSGSWRAFQNANFTSWTARTMVATDPETGFIYLPSGGEDFTGREMMLSVDVKTGTVNTTDLFRCMMKTTTITGVLCNILPAHRTSIPPVIVWSGLLRSFLILENPGFRNPVTFTPSKETSGAEGWSSLAVTGWKPNTYRIFECGAPAYGGSKLVFIVTGVVGTEGSYLYILDVAECTWKEGVPPPIPMLQSTACAVTGDQFISWGGGFAGNGTATNATLVYNLKTETWTSEYIGPFPVLSTSDSTSREKGLVNTILVVTGALLTVILTAISVYIGLSKRLEDINDSGSDSSGASSNHHSRRNWFLTRLLGRLPQKSYGARPLSGDPHAVLIDPTSGRSVQEGAVQVEFPIQHPHTMVEQDSSTNHNIKDVGNKDNGHSMTCHPRTTSIQDTSVTSAPDQASSVTISELYQHKQ